MGISILSPSKSQLKSIERYFTEQYFLLTLFFSRDEIEHAFADGYPVKAVKTDLPNQVILFFHIQVDGSNAHFVKLIQDGVIIHGVPEVFQLPGIRKIKDQEGSTWLQRLIDFFHGSLTTRRATFAQGNHHADQIEFILISQCLSADLFHRNPVSQTQFINSSPAHLNAVAVRIYANKPALRKGLSQLD